MIVQEQHQFEVVGILVKVVGYLAAQGLVALDAAPRMDFLQQDVAIGKIKDTVDRWCPVPETRSACPPS